MVKYLVVSFLWLGLVSICCGQFTKEGFRIAEAGYEYAFPQDHGSHPEYKIEWWYITGHLFEDGKASKRFGFQATFFRVGLARPGTPGAEAAPGLESFATNHLHMAHMALIDVETGTFLHEERLNREGWDASAKVGGLDCRNGNWRLRRLPAASADGPMVMKLLATVQGRARMDLELKAAQSHVIFGEDGVSKKGADASAASLYITFPRLAVSGSLWVDGRERKVTGQAWMDHEISSSQLSEDQVGWDWASVQFEDGRSLMIYQLRLKDGSADPYSKLVWIEADGSMVNLSPEKWSWTGERIWKSPVTGGAYPLDIRVRTEDPAGKPFEFVLRPVIDHQEMVGRLGGVSYWEGSCNVEGADGKRLGLAYVELTGYVEGGLGALRTE